MHGIVGVQSILGGEAVANVILGVLEHYRVALAEGCLITVKQHKTTHSKLPIGSQ